MEKDNEKIEPQAVQTYAEDMASVLQNDTGGLIKKIIHGEEEAEKEKRDLSPESKKNKLFLIISLILVFLAAAILLFFVFQKSIGVVDVQKQFVPLVFNDATDFIEVKDMKPDAIAQTIANEVENTKVKIGGVEGIYPSVDKQIIGLRAFLALMKSSFAPGDTVLVSNSFLMGVVNSNTKDFFILLKERSVPDIFDPLRAWESKMFSDLHGFFGVDISADTKYLLTKDFTDGVIQNKNARILYDTNGKVVMMYIFADDSSVIITNTESAAREIMLRLASGQVAK